LSLRFARLLFDFQAPPLQLLYKPAHFVVILAAQAGIFAVAEAKADCILNAPISVIAGRDPFLRLRECPQRQQAAVFADNPVVSQGIFTDRNRAAAAFPVELFNIRFAYIKSIQALSVVFLLRPQRKHKKRQYENRDEKDEGQHGQQERSAPIDIVPVNEHNPGAGAGAQGAAGDTVLQHAHAFLSRRLQRLVRAELRLHKAAAAFAALAVPG